MCGSRHCGEDEGSKLKQDWDGIKRRNDGDFVMQRHYGMKRPDEDVVDIAETMMEARLRWYGHVNRKDEEDIV